MNETIKNLLANRLLAMADDELILAHRNSEWIGHGPILEEDIAIANIAQDELGHATVWFHLHKDLTGADPDQLAFLRDPAGFRNVQLVELPKGDWAVTILRQYLFDAYELALFTALQGSLYTPLAQAIGKIRNEEIYHFRHTSVWVQRLGLGTAESHGRLQTALNQLWPYVGQLFQQLPGEEELVALRYWPALPAVFETWHKAVVPHLQQAGLELPAGEFLPLGRAEHTPHLTELLAEMQKVARLDPEAFW